jgi:phenylpyruvate tautomerase PptA (4-oxalocrotonate tautomerase family)
LLRILYLSELPYWDLGIKISDKNVSIEDKEKLIKGVTDLLAFVIIDEVSIDNWG